MSEERATEDSGADGDQSPQFGGPMNFASFEQGASE